jgi:NADH:ubiquinone oxidoreductase subunit C
MTATREPTVQTKTSRITTPVPGAVLEVTKTGLVCEPTKARELARYLRDQQGYDYCSMVTSIDWPQYIEVVYYLYGVAQPKDALVLRFRLTDKANPVMPSLTPVWIGADFQEREVYDMMGIRFEGHPNLRRILLWEGFEGYPLRKDFKEALLRGGLQALQEPPPRWRPSVGRGSRAVEG